jgi:hypothetical protein
LTTGGGYCLKTVENKVAEDSVLFASDFVGIFVGILFV